MLLFESDGKAEMAALSRMGVVPLNLRLGSGHAHDVYRQAHRAVESFDSPFGPVILKVPFAGHVNVGRHRQPRHFIKSL